VSATWPPERSVRVDELAIPEQRNEAYELIRREKWIGLQIAEKAGELMERQAGLYFDPHRVV
jgi:hypothetical protein